MRTSIKTFPLLSIHIYCISDRNIYSSSLNEPKASARAFHRFSRTAYSAIGFHSRIPLSRKKNLFEKICHQSWLQSTVDFSSHHITVRHATNIYSISRHGTNVTANDNDKEINFFNCTTAKTTN